MNFCSRFVVAIAVPVLLTACASVPSSAPGYKRQAPAPAGLVNLYIYRVGANPTMRTPTLYVDEKKVFEPPELSYTVIQVSAGKHSVKTEWNWDTGAPNLAFTIDVPPGESYYLKLSGDFKAAGLTWTTTSLARRIEQDVAERELQNCCKFVSNSF